MGKNVEKLFTRSEDMRFRYREYVSDGDLRIVKTLRDLKPYGGKSLYKCECSNHLEKRNRNNIEKFSKWDKILFQRNEEKRVNARDKVYKKAAEAQHREE